MSSAKIGVYSKSDFLMLYGVTMPVFENWITDISIEIGWQKGKRQKFPPKIVQIIFDHLGEPK